MYRNCRIMIVDDEFIMRQGIRYMMNWEKEGYEVVGEASNGKEALDMLESTKPDIILCDIAMPIMDGLDFIKIVKKEYPNIQILVLSSYDRFDYVRQALLNGAVDYVLKPTLNPEELLKIVSKTAKNIPGLILKQNENTDYDVKLERYFVGSDGQLNAWHFNSIFNASCYRLFVVCLRQQDKQGIDLSNVLYEKIETIMKEYKYGKYLKFIYNQETLCIVLNYGIKDEKDIFEFLNSLMRQLSLLYDKIFGNLSLRRMNLEELKNDFQDPNFMGEEIFYHKGYHLYIQEEKSNIKICDKFDFRKFSRCLGEHNYKEAIELFRDYAYNATESRMPEFKLKNQIKNLLYNIISSPNDNIIQLEELRREYFEKIEKVLYCEEFLQIIEELVNKLDNILLQGDNGDFYLRKILDYIQIHYKEELNLKNLADEFNFNYSYLSAYFNSHMKEGFSEYLNRVRIEKACEYLEKGEYPIAKISSMIGYSDHSYFCRVFKKITGKTPSVYKHEGRRK